MYKTLLAFPALLALTFAAPTRRLVARGCTSYHTVVSGDTCWALSQAQGMALADFEALNAGTNCWNLQIGEQ